MAVSNLKNNISIIEQDTETISSVTWTYRKWSDGTAECWCLTPHVSKTISTSYGSGFYGAKDNYYFPIGLFASSEISVTASLRDSGSIGTWFSIQNISTTDIGGYVFSITSNTVNLRLGIHAIGRWK